MSMSKPGFGVDATAPVYRTYQDLVQEAELASAWLESHGVRVNGTRLATLIKHLRGWIEAHTQGRMPDASSAKHIWSLIELEEFTEIYRHLKLVQDQRFLNTLREITSGAHLLDEEGTAGSANRARNFTFELNMAARLARAGLPVQFTSDADATVELAGLPVAVECKRLAIEDVMEDNIKKAHKQIVNRIANCEAEHGIIVLSLTRLLYRNDSGEVDVVCDDPQALQARLRQELTDLGPLITSRFAHMAPKTLAIIFQYKLPIVSAIDGTSQFLNRFFAYSLLSESASPPAAAFMALHDALMSSVGH